MHYFDRIASLPLPTPEQTAAFAEHVADNHSWYKHLPFFPPGASFVFFLNPHAGEAVEHTDRGFVPEPIPEGDYFRHHSRLATADYRRRFGHWDYWVDENPRVPQRIEGPWLYGTGPDGREPFPADLKPRWSCRLTAFLRGGPLLSGGTFDHERAEFEAFARAHPADPHVPRYLALARVLRAGDETARRALRAFQQTELDTQRQLVLQTLLMVRIDCAARRAPAV